MLKQIRKWYWAAKVTWRIENGTLRPFGDCPYGILCLIFAELETCSLDDPEFAQEFEIMHSEARAELETRRLKLSRKFTGIFG